VPGGGTLGLQRVRQIDHVKGIAIVSVLVLHTWPIGLLLAAGAVLHIWQAVPVFMVLLGLNSTMSFRKHQAYTLSQVYAPVLLRARTIRIVVPLVPVMVVSAVVAVALRATHATYHVNLGAFTLLGFLPTGGPGNYFTALLIESVIVLPFMWWCYRRSPIATVVAAYAIAVCFELLAGRVSFFVVHPLFYAGCILRFLPAIACGMWLSEGWGPTRRNVWVLIAAASGALVLLSQSLIGFSVPGFFEGVSQSFVAAAYAAALLMLGLALLPSSSRAPAWSWLGTAGRASYHVFLLQILYFGVVAVPLLHALGLAGANASHVAAATVLNIGMCVPAGVVYERLERRALRWFSVTGASA